VTYRDVHDRRQAGLAGHGHLDGAGRRPGAGLAWGHRADDLHFSHRAV